MTRKSKRWVLGGNFGSIVRCSAPPFPTAPIRYLVPLIRLQNLEGMRLKSRAGRYLAWRSESFVQKAHRNVIIHPKLQTGERIFFSRVVKFISKRCCLDLRNTNLS